MYEVGSIVYDDWKIVGKIGEGSFGNVYEINRRSFGQIYTAALKVIKIPSSDDEIRRLRTDYATKEAIKKHLDDQVQELVNEISLMSSLKGTSYTVSYEDHKVVPQPNGFGWDILIRMEKLTPFQDYIAEHPFTQRDVVQVGIDICKALELCHSHNIIHRDVKQANLFVTSHSNYKLGDFGIARKLEKTLKADMSIKGTYRYMAPEICREDSRYGYGVDIYSLGIVLYELLNKNRGPFFPDFPSDMKHSDFEEAKTKRMRGDPMPHPAYGEGQLGEIVLKACAFEASDRYASAFEMRKALEEVLFVVDKVEQIIPGSNVARKPIEMGEEGTDLAESEDEEAPTELEFPQGEDGGTVLGEKVPVKKGPGVIDPPTPVPLRRKKGPAIALVIALIIASIAVGLFGAHYVSEKKTTDTYTKYIQDAKACRENNPERAMELYLAAQKLIPEEEAGYVGYAYTLYLNRDFEAAINYIEKDLSLGKAFSIETQSELSEILASSYFEMDEFAKAASFFALSGSGRPMTGYALCNYAVSLGRLGDYEAAESVIEEMIADGASGAEITYVQAEVAYAQDFMTSAEPGFISVLSSTDNLALKRRTLRSLGNLYLECIEMNRLGFSTIQDPDIKGIELLETGIVEYNLRYDHSMLELLAKMYYESYMLDEANRAPYLESSAELFERIMDMGVKKDYFYQNLYNIYYQLQWYDQAEGIVQEYKKMYPKDYVPYAMRTILLLTLEGHKQVEERNYTTAFNEFETAEILSEQADDLGYYYNAKYYIDELITNGWDDFELRQAGTENPSSEEPKEGVYNPEGNPYEQVTIGKVVEDGFYFHYMVNDVVYCSYTKATRDEDVFSFTVYYENRAEGTSYVGLAGHFRFLNDGTLEFVITDSPHQAKNGTKIFAYTSEIDDAVRNYFEEEINK